jgi:hypothetical protein
MVRSVCIESQGKIQKGDVRGRRAISTCNKASFCSNCMSWLRQQQLQFNEFRVERVLVPAVKTHKTLLE